jgi:peptide/nickel transport system substrate-binding protein
VPVTGPYEVASHRKNHGARLVRDPSFREWSSDAQPDGYPDVVSFEVGTPDSLGRVRSVERGAAEVALDLNAPPLPRQEYAALAVSHSSQLHSDATSGTQYFFLNTQVAPFDDVRVRRAVSYAFDRSAFVRLLGPGYAPTCKLLPPNFPAYRKTCPYASGGTAGLDRAQRLVRSSGTAGTSVTVWMPVGPGPAQGRFMVCC